MKHGDGRRGRRSGERNAFKFAGVDSEAEDAQRGGRGEGRADGAAELLEGAARVRRAVAHRTGGEDSEVELGEEGEMEASDVGGARAEADGGGAVDGGGAAWAELACAAKN